MGYLTLTKKQKEPLKGQHALVVCPSFLAAALARARGALTRDPFVDRDAEDSEGLQYTIRGMEAIR